MADDQIENKMRLRLVIQEVDDEGVQNEIDLGEFKFTDYQPAINALIMRLLSAHKPCTK